MALRDDDPKRLPSQRRHFHGVDHPGHFVGEHSLDILIAKRLGHRDHQIRGVTGEGGGVGLVSQPGGQARNEPSRADPLADDIGVEEVLLDELAESRGELVLALDDQCGVRYRQAKGPAEQGRDREPVRDTSDHGRLGSGLHVAERSPVSAGYGHRHEHSRGRREKSGGAPACGGQAACSQLRGLMFGRGHRRGRHRGGRFH